VSKDHHPPRTPLLRHSIPLHATNSASAAPQNQANCIAKKFAEKLGEDRIRPSVYSPAQPFAPQLRHRSLRKINCSLQNALAEKKSCMVGCDVAS